MLLRPNESICIQGAFFLSHAGGSKRAATWEPVQRLVGALAVFPKQTRKYKHRLALNSPFFFSSFEEVEKAVVTHSALLLCTVPSLAPFCFSVRIESEREKKSRGGLCTESWDYSTSSSTSRRVAAVDVFTSE